MLARKIWYAKHDTAFLVWFDYSLDNENDIDFNLTIANHFKIFTGQEFSDTQIRSRIDRFVREDNEKCDGRSVTALIFREKGSSSLLSLSAETREQIKTLMQKYTADYLSGDRKKK